MLRIREPERRLYRELVATGLRVQLREDRQSGQPAYDIADLLLRFDVFRVYADKLSRFNISSFQTSIEGV